MARGAPTPPLGWDRTLGPALVCFPCLPCGVEPQKPSGLPACRAAEAPAPGRTGVHRRVLLVPLDHPIHVQQWNGTQTALAGGWATWPSLAPGIRWTTATVGPVPAIRRCPAACHALPGADAGQGGRRPHSPGTPSCRGTTEPRSVWTSTGGGAPWSEERRKTHRPWTRAPHQWRVHHLGASTGRAAHRHRLCRPVQRRTPQRPAAQDARLRVPGGPAHAPAPAQRSSSSGAFSAPADQQ
jgi:hypothetical protein